MRHDDEQQLETLERELEDLGRTSPQDEAVRARLRVRLMRRAAELPARRSRLSRRVFPQSRVRLAGALAIAVSIVGLVSYASLTERSTLSGPTDASAATILHAAAASGLAPGEAGHYVYTFTVSGPGIGEPPGEGAVEVWINRSATVSISQQTVTLGGAKADGQNPYRSTLVGRFVELGRDVFGYDASHNALSLPSERNAAPAIVLPNEVYDGAALASTIGQLAARGSRVVALPPQTLEGVPVEVIQADGALDRPALRLTLYFDAQTHVLRGFDAASDDPSYPTPSWRVRLQSQTTVPASSVPPGTFALHLPAGTRVEERLRGALPAACGGITVVPDRGSSPNSRAWPARVSPLAVCRQHDPSLTADQLVAALAQEPDTQLQQAVAGGILSPQEASAARAMLQSQLARLVAGQPAGLG
jgi:hypothetical protein